MTAARLGGSYYAYTYTYAYVARARAISVTPGRHEEYNKIFAGVSVSCFVFRGGRLRGKSREANADEKVEEEA